MRMFGVGIRRVVVIMVVVMVMIMVVMVVVMIRRLKTTHAGTESITKRTIRDVRARRIGALPFNVVVVAFLNCAHFTLEP
jgi:flagellar basal body-associated protein FliL